MALSVLKENAYELWVQGNSTYVCNGIAVQRLFEIFTYSKRRRPVNYRNSVNEVFWIYWTPQSCCVLVLFCSLNLGPFFYLAVFTLFFCLFCLFAGQWSDQRRAVARACTSQRLERLGSFQLIGHVEWSCESLARAWSRRRARRLSRRHACSRDTWLHKQRPWWPCQRGTRGQRWPACVGVCGNAWSAVPVEPVWGKLIVRCDWAHLCHWRGFALCRLRIRLRIDNV